MTKPHYLFAISSLLALCLLVPAASQTKSRKKAKPTTSKSAKVIKPVAASSPSNETAAEKKTAIPQPNPAETESQPASNKKTQNAEPTEEEMKQAIINSAVNQGAEKTSSSGVATNNAFAGASIRIEDFEKIGCAPANYGVGFICTYNIRASMAFHSNEGTAAGDRHAQAINNLARLLGGKPKTETTTSRFVRTKNGWLVTKD